MGEAVGYDAGGKIGTERLGTAFWERAGSEMKGGMAKRPCAGESGCRAVCGDWSCLVFLIEHRHDDSLAIIAEFPAEKVYTAYKSGSFAHGDTKGNIGLGRQVQRLQGDVGIFSFPSR